MSEPTPKILPVELDTDRRSRQAACLRSCAPAAADLSCPASTLDRCSRPRLVRWSDHPVLSKPPVIRGIIPADGSPARVDMSVGDQLRQRAAMGGERERAALAAFEALLSKCIADALVAEVRKEAEAHGVDGLTWLTRDKRTDE